MTNIERIEAYFNNELSEVDREKLLQDIDADTALKEDFQFQENVIEGIKAYRKKELIARLDGLEIASPSQAMLLKTLGGVGIAGIIAVSTYMWVNNADKNSISEEVNNIEQVIAQTEETQEAIQPSTDIKLAEEPKTEEKEEITTTTETKKTAPAKIASNQPATAAPQIVIPDVQEPETESQANIDEDLTAPKAMSSSAIRLSSSTDVEVRLNKKYNFHYQVKNGGLTLFGNFNESPFEVIELKTNKGINSYLYFKEHFYSLANDSEDIRPLMVIKNAQLIKELEKRR
jgi:hypothetical protein